MDKNFCQFHFLWKKCIFDEMMKIRAEQNSCNDLWTKTKAAVAFDQLLELLSLSNSKFDNDESMKKMIRRTLHISDVAEIQKSSKPD